MRILAVTANVLLFLFTHDANLMTPAPVKPAITRAQVDAVDVRVGTITSVHDVPGKAAGTVGRGVVAARLQAPASTTSPMRRPSRIRQRRMRVEPPRVGPGADSEIVPAGRRPGPARRRSSTALRTPSRPRRRRQRRGVRIRPGRPRDWPHESSHESSPPGPRGTDPWYLRWTCQ